MSQRGLSSDRDVVQKETSWSFPSRLVVSDGMLLLIFVLLPLLGVLVVEGVGVLVGSLGRGPVVYMCPGGSCPLLL